MIYLYLKTWEELTQESSTHTGKRTLKIADKFLEEGKDFCITDDLPKPKLVIDVFGFPAFREFGIEWAMNDEGWAAWHPRTYGDEPVEVTYSNVIPSGRTRLSVIKEVHDD